MASMEITQLIERCKQGDSAALGELYKTYAPKMKGVCRRYLSEKEAINDVLHDSFVIIFTSFDKLRDNNKAEYWMLSITRNVASKYKDFQKNHRNVALEESGTNVPLTEEQQDDAAIEISLNELMSLVEKLPDGYGKLFRLAVFEGMSHKEIAAMLNIEPHSASSQLARAKKMLRTMIQKSWPVLLLLLIPVTLLLLRKENPIADEAQPIATTQEETPKTMPTEQEPVIVHQPTRHTNTNVPTTHVPRKINVTTNKQITADTLTDMLAQEVIITDTLSENQQNDTMEYMPRTEMPQYNLADIFHNDDIEKTLRTSSLRWSLGVAYTGSINEQTINTAKGDDDFCENVIKDNTDESAEEILRYDIKPITLALMVRYKQSRRFAFESGVCYIRQVSDFGRKRKDNISYNSSQVTQHIGLPIKGIFTMASGKRWSLYGNLGITMGIPVKSQIYVSGVTRSTAEQLDLTAPQAQWLWFPSTGFGIQCNLTKNIGIYAEPSIKYYISSYDIKHPFAFSLPLGIKILW